MDPQQRTRQSEGSAAPRSSSTTSSGLYLSAGGKREQVKATVRNVLRRKKEEEDITPRNFARRQGTHSLARRQGVSSNDEGPAEESPSRWNPFFRRHHNNVLESSKSSVWKKAIHRIQGGRSADSDTSTKATDSRMQSASPEHYSARHGARSSVPTSSAPSVHGGSAQVARVAVVSASTSQLPSQFGSQRSEAAPRPTLRSSNRYYVQQTPQNTRVRAASRPRSVARQSIKSKQPYLTEKGTPVDLTRFFDPKPWNPSRFTRLQRLAPAIHGEVSLFHDNVENRKVVIKQLTNSSVRPRGPQELENPLVEIGAMSYLFSDRAVYPVDLIAKLEGVYRDDLHTYLVTEYCTDGELFKEIVKRKSLSERHVKAIALQLALALHSLHKNGICHRDVSLENTLIQSDHTVRLIDFGQAECCHEPDGSMKLMHGSAGKAYYRAPEMLRGPYHGPPVDVFALGVEIFIMAIGSPPWAKASLQDQRYRSLTKYRTSLDISLRKWGKRDGLSDAFVDILSTIFTSNPQQRPTIEQLLCHPWFSCK
ncbi:protein kinase domain protein [Gregarina niphandrodes]|uniref:Protein kinase domain protein n=1 Tax=Gregarina niphandrodes TaxID=110365 RepID=A0A023B172_GRENI|nr:protein kinase domain protein [Gregarina niphandrodes]EZG46766.1 protein kinase domain protein [Gregarina niphandrodes]|eukprot:XP_011132275.1 protein kinase domain protein [Gregarina niphandrodes]